jgi:mannose-6-phosphate isomerase
MNFEFLQTTTDKLVLFNELRNQIIKQGFSLVNEDSTRPWGGFFVIDEKNASLFQQTFLSDLDLDPSQINLKLSPKILVVEPSKRLSWQYHNRRAEVWKLIGGEGQIVRSDNDSLGSSSSMVLGELIKLRQGERHRLIGGNSWTIVAEIWIHTDPNFPSDEEDIIRVEDDFARV